GAGLDPLIEIDDVLVSHADAARGDRLADIFRLVGAVDAVERVLVALEQIHRARAHRIVRAGADEVRDFHALLDFRGRGPRRPLFLAADLGDAGPGQRFFADR